MEGIVTQLKHRTQLYQVQPVAIWEELHEFLGVFGINGVLMGALSD